MSSMLEPSSDELQDITSTILEKLQGYFAMIAGMSLQHAVRLHSVTEQILVFKQAANTEVRKLYAALDAMTERLEKMSAKTNDMSRSVPCRFFLQGKGCTKGDSCRFSHVATAARQQSTTKGELFERGWDKFQPNRAPTGAETSQPALYLPEFVRNHRVLISTGLGGQFLVDSSKLQSTGPALGYRKSMRLDDMAETGVLYGSLVSGVLQNGWLKVHPKAAVGSG